MASTQQLKRKVITLTGLGQQNLDDELVLYPVENRNQLHTLKWHTKLTTEGAEVGSWS